MRGLDKLLAVSDPGERGERVGNGGHPAARPGLSGDLWRSIAPTYAAILDHPFLAGLADGTLSHERFRHYVEQDAIYLRDFARALGIASARSPHEDALAMFAEHAVGAITVERVLHESFFEEIGLSRADVERTPTAPTTLAYTSYLLRVAYAGDYPQVLGAVLPCYWIYWEVGKRLGARGSPEPRYQRWIDAYGGEEFCRLVEAVLAVVDRVGDGVTPRQRAAVETAFVVTSRYEWVFWDMGWTLEVWPI